MNTFTVDLEDWYHANYHLTPQPNKTSQLTDPTLRILDLLRQSHSKATFFVLGVVAKEHPDLIREIAKNGHEIACHSYDHKLIYNMTRAQFEDDLIKATNIIHKVTGKFPIGYRAPSWSVGLDTTPWFWKTLKKHGYKYSSSLFPFKTFLYGDSKNNPLQQQIDGIKEFPPTTIRILNTNVPFSGGFYLRALPLPIIQYFSKINSSKKIGNIYYIHPREIDALQPKLSKLSIAETIIHYYNIKNTYHKLKKLLAYKATSFQDIYFKKNKI